MLKPVVCGRMMLYSYVLFLLLFLTKVTSRNDTANIQMLEKECTKEGNILYPNKGTTIYHFTTPNFFLCHSLNSSDMVFTSRGYNYTQFHDQWSNMKAYNVSCGIGLVFESIECLQHKQVYDCVVRHNGTNITRKLTTYAYGVSPGIYKFERTVDRADDKVIPGSTFNLTCYVLKPPAHVNITFHVKKLMITNMISNSTGKSLRLYPQEVINKEQYNGDIKRTLTIYNYSYADDGEYTCHVVMVGCLYAGKTPLKLVGYRGPFISSFSKTSKPENSVSKNIVLTCVYSTTSNERPDCSFFKWNASSNATEHFKEAKGRYHYNQPTYSNGMFSRTLTIYNANKSDAGIYSCHVVYEDKGDNTTYELVFDPLPRGTLRKGNDNPFPSYFIGIIALVTVTTVVLVALIVNRRRKMMVESRSRRQIETSEHHDVVEIAFNNYTNTRIETENDMNLESAMELTDHVYDVFICYSSFDREWVKNTLLNELEIRGVKACIDYRDFLVGAYIVENITDAIYGSRKTIAVLSPDFMNSVYCKHELQTALSRMANHQVIPVLYRPCDVPSSLTDKTYLDWCHADVRPYFWTLLVNAIMTNTAV